MPRELTFRFKKKEYKATPTKVDRKKLYGWTEILALDEQGRECKLINTDDTGTIMISKGGTALGILDSQGKWVERSTLKTVLSDGSPAPVITSSYNTIIDLKDKVADEEFLDYSITDFYQLNIADDNIIRTIGNNIYTFEYSYLDSYEAIPAFLMVAESTLFMLLGYKNKFDMLCLGDCGNIDEENDDYIDVSDDDLDFSMF